jgi:hypothetical protein
MERVPSGLTGRRALVSFCCGVSVDDVFGKGSVVALTGTRRTGQWIS